MYSISRYSIGMAFPLVGPNIAAAVDIDSGSVFSSFFSEALPLWFVFPRAASIPW